MINNNFTNSLRGSKNPPPKKKIEKPRVKTPIIEVKEPEPKVVVKEVVKEVYIDKTPPLVAIFSKQKGFDILPTRKAMASLGKNVYVRVKPLLDEQTRLTKSLECTENKIKLDECSYAFDKVCYKEDQIKFFGNFNGFINEILNGANVSVISMGSSKSGKTYSLIGDNINDINKQGLMMKTISKLFNFMLSMNNCENNYMLKFSAGRVNKTTVNDLLNMRNQSNIDIAELSNGEVVLPGLNEVFLQNEEEFIFYMNFIRELINNTDSQYSYLYNFEFVQKFPLIEVKSKFKFFDFCEDLNSISKVVEYLSNEKNPPDPNFVSKAPFNSLILKLMKNSLFGNYKTLFLVNFNPLDMSNSIEYLKFAEKAQKLAKFEKSKTYNKVLEEYIKKLENTKTVNDKEISKKTENNANKDPKEIETLRKKLNEMEKEIEKLRKENEELKKMCSYEKLSSNIGESFYKNAKEMNYLYETFKKSIEKVYKEENIMLKELINKYEKEALEETKGIVFEAGLDFVNFDCYSRIKILAVNLGTIMDTLAKEGGESYIMNSYVNLYNNCLFVVNDILKDFTLNKDIFTTNEINTVIEDKVTIKRSSYNFLKNSYSQLSILLIHYEKLLCDILNKMYIDLKNIQTYERFSKQYEGSIMNLNFTMVELIALFEKFRELKQDENTKKAKKVELMPVEREDQVNFFKYVSKNKIVNLDDNTKQVKLLEDQIMTLKTENKMKSLHFDSLKLEIEELRKLKNNYENSLFDFQNNSKIAFEQELSNQVIAFNTLKKSFLEEINMAKNIVNGLSELIEEFLANKDFYSLEKNRKMFTNCYLTRAKKFLGEVKDEKNMAPRRSIIYNIHEKFIIDEGTATKKLDVFMDNQKNNNLVYDSGLSCSEKTKGPMKRILKENLKGDSANDVWSQEV